MANWACDSATCEKEGAFLEGGIENQVINSKSCAGKWPLGGGATTTQLLQFRNIGTA
jgi:hypothetical protein